MDYIKEIPNESIDLLLTDPPYNISRKNNFSTMGRTGVDYGDWDKDFNQVDWLELVIPKIKLGGTLVIWNSRENLGLLKEILERNGVDYKDVVYWLKSNPMPRNRDRRYVNPIEPAVVGVKRGAKWVFNRQRDTYENGIFKYPIVSAKDRIHTTQKPVEMFKDLIRIHSKEGDIVFDPFMGSATTAIACLETGRKYFGCEIDDNYYNMSNQRISDYYFK